MDFTSKMNYYDLFIHGAKAFDLRAHLDNRGRFSETFRESWLADAGISNKFLFDCYSVSSQPGTVRGLHAQTESAPQAKLVTVIKGAVQDIIVDARINSPTYGKHCAVLISENSPKLVYIPAGCYHGFVTLAPDTILHYKMDNYHSPQHERGVAYNDPDLNIDWTFFPSTTISERDSQHPSWKNSYKFENLL
jgi:dTDP-4-dehydrorhamnose 3,5-epimerase